jgi:beta-glucosidase
MTVCEKTALKANIGIAVVGEYPYPEGAGDSRNLELSRKDKDLIEKMRKRCNKLVIILISGQPLIITDLIEGWDTVIAAWLPDTEGQGVADVLFSDFPFTGKLSHTWSSSVLH